MYRHNFNKKRGQLTLQQLSDGRAVVIEATYAQYEGVDINHMEGTLEECETFYRERKQQVSPPKVRADHNTRI